MTIHTDIVQWMIEHRATHPGASCGEAGRAYVVAHSTDGTVAALYAETGVGIGAIRAAHAEAERLTRLGSAS